MVKNLKTHLEKIKQFDKDRLLWLKLSGVVAFFISLIIINLLFFKVESIHWITISISLGLSVSWWYWTMRILQDLLNHRLAEVEILADIINDIKEIKNDVKKLDQKS